MHDPFTGLDQPTVASAFRVQVVTGGPVGPGVKPVAHVAVQLDPAAAPSHLLAGQVLLAEAVGSVAPVQPAAVVVKVEHEHTQARISALVHVMRG